MVTTNKKMSKSNRKMLCGALGGAVAAALEMFTAWLAHPFPTGGGAVLGTALTLVCTYINTED